MRRKRTSDNGPQPDTIGALPNFWRALATDLRRHAADGAAAAYEIAAAQLDHCLRIQGDRLLGAAEAAALIECHRDTIGHALRDGRLTNHGTKYRPLVRFSELIHAFRTPAGRQVATPLAESSAERRASGPSGLPASDRFLRLPEVKQKTGLSRSAIYSFIKDGTFPSQTKIGPGAAAWLESDIDSWMGERIDTSRGNAR